MHTVQPHSASSLQLKHPLYYFFNPKDTGSNSSNSVGGGSQGVLPQQPLQVAEFAWGKLYETLDGILRCLSGSVSYTCLGIGFPHHRP